MTIENINTCLRYAWQLVGAIEFKKAVLAVNRVNKKRAMVEAKLDSWIANPSQFSKYFQQDTDKNTDDPNK